MGAAVATTLSIPQADDRPWRLHDYKNWQRSGVKGERSRRAAGLFNADATSIGRPQATPYFLRHTYASLRLAEQQLSLHEIAEEMGHTAAARWSTSSVRATRATSAPSAASARPTASPMPRLPPVTTARRPVSSRSTRRRLSGVRRCHTAGRCPV